MSLFNNQTDAAKIYDLKRQSSTFLAQQLPVYIVCIGLGLLSGVIGVTLAIGLAIIIELYFLTVNLSAVIVLLTLAAVGAGWGVTWVLRGLSSRFFHTNYDAKEIQVMFIASTLIALLQLFVYMQGF